MFLSGRYRLCESRVETEGSGKVFRIFGRKAQLVDLREPEQRPRPSLPRRGGTLRDVGRLASDRPQRPHAGHGQRIRLPRHLHGSGKKQ